MVCAAFEEVRPHLHVQAPVTVTGNPSRAAFEELYRRLQKQRSASSPTAAEASRRQRRLVILGGSGGARTINESIQSALKKLGDLLNNWQIVHQTGDGQLLDTENRYNRLGLRALAVAHIDELASVLFASDVVVCRAGGSTLAELALAGVPAVVVPFPQAADNHQMANAKVFAAAAACRLIDETQCGGALDAALARELQPLVADDRLREEMGRNMQKLARPDAASQIAGAVADQLCGGVSALLAA
jgi:UDP-N-acetylglucosamine--N-acetylmuramyl-(pentapeptide) pyrophosphoryl-undecaprenol N-acetylglucosamine transferase